MINGNAEVCTILVVSRRKYIKLSVLALCKYMKVLNVNAGQRYDVTCQAVGSRPVPSITWWVGENRVDHLQTRLEVLVLIYELQKNFDYLSIKKALSFLLLRTLVSMAVHLLYFPYVGSNCPPQ